MHLGRISHVGLLLADNVDGPFECEIESVGAFRYDDRSTRPLPWHPPHRATLGRHTCPIWRRYDEEDEFRDDEVRRGLKMNREHGYAGILAE